MRRIIAFQFLFALFLSACTHTQRAAFVPSQHGFAFRNSFVGDPIPDFLRDSPVGALIRKSADAGLIEMPERFGLCGGMCAAATDYWLNAIPVPSAVVAPSPGEKLYEYLKMRQADSLGSGGVMALKFIEWMQLDERAPGRCTQELSRTELKSILAAVQDEGFAHVGLVYVDRTGLPWQNHQVLVCGFSRVDATVTMQIYDPNFPRRDDVELVVRLEEDVHGRKFACTTQRWKGGERHVRGVFLMPYKVMKPQK